MISKNTDNQPWYRLKVRNKGLIEEAQRRLAESSISFVYLSDKTYPASCLQFLASNYVQFLYVNTDIDTITNFLEKEKDSNIYKLSRDNHNVPVLYDDLIIRQTEMILHNYNGEIRITNSIPSKAKECSIDYLHMKDFKGYYQKVQKAPIDKFYIKLLENINIFIPVPKGTYKEPTEKKEEEKLYREKTRWMVLRTFNEEKWYDILCNWNIDMADAIRIGEARPCFPFLPKRKYTDRNGVEHIKLLCHGYLFLKTTISNLPIIDRNIKYGIPNLSRAVMKSKFDGKMRPVTINENAMTNFMFATSICSGELEYDSFDYCIDEHVVYTNSDSAFFGRVGKLSRKGKDLYIAFSIGNELGGNIQIPAIKVNISNIRKLTEEEVQELEREG